MPFSRTIKLFALISLGAVSHILAEQVSLVEALDAPDLTWVASGDVHFEGTPADDAWQGSYAQATLQNGESSVLTATIPGPGVIDFSIRNLPANGLTIHNWSATLDGVPLDLSPGSWPYGFLVEGQGPHSLVISVSSNKPQQNIVILDAAAFVPEASADLSQSLDQEGQNWTTSGDGNWLGNGMPFFSVDGVDVARSGPLDDGETSSLHTTVEGPAEVSFWWRTTEGSQSSGTFYIDDILISATNLFNPDPWE